METANNNVLSYPTMARQRADKIQAKEVAYAEDVNAEFDHIVDVYNRLIMMLTGEWGDDTGRIYELVDNAVATANEALNKINDCVQKSGDTMTGHLNISLVPSSDYNVVNKKYVDDTIDAELADPVNRISELEKFKDNLKAEQVKLENSNFAANNVHDGLSELFISVSNGKKTVADAITGKGVETSGDASFKQMADNINAILTFNEGTTGGTATPQDILQGKTAFARGNLIVGTYVPIDLSDGNATPDKIVSGYVAYTAAGRVVGTYTPPQDYPVYGTDTTDATAYSSDILYGKTAYARGQKLVGTLQNTDVEEIYGLDVASAKVKSLQELLIDTITKDTVNVEMVAYSKDLDYVVRLTHLNDDTSKKYLESYPINEDGYYVQQTASVGGEFTIKKYRYTLEELGIPEDETITDIVLSAKGLYGSENKCRLLITTVKQIENDSVAKVYFLTYHLSDNGIIGRAYEGEYLEDTVFELYKFTTEYTGDFYVRLVTSNLEYNRFMAIVKKSISTSTTITAISCRISGELLFKRASIGKQTRADISRDIKYVFTADDKYIYNVGKAASTITTTVFIEVNKNDEYYPEVLIELTGTERYTPIEGTGLWVKGSTSNVVSLRNIELYNFNGDGFTKVKEIQRASTYTIRQGFATKDMLVLFTTYTISGETIWYIQIYNIDVSTIVATEPIASDQSITISDAAIVEGLINNLENIMFICGDNRDLKKLTFDVNVDNILAIKYKGNFYYNMKSQELTAGQGDVRKGKTFIGWMGYPEEGTMEV